MRYKLTIAYDGTHYSGWQVQPNARSIQSLVQKALETALRHPIDLTGSGRTDAGVHARGQTAHFDTPLSLDLSRLRLSLNALLPPDIRALEIENASADFHARYSATSKTYHYNLHLEAAHDPFTRLYRHKVLGPCHLEKIRAALPHFLGTHDFTSFANQRASASPSRRGATRTMLRLELFEQKGGARLEFESTGFLYKMVRNITGCLLDVGAGKLAPEAIPTILAAKDRRMGREAAPPQGLFLMQVNY
jgi:tRNA pseudouridine38-40 synthase